MLANHPKFVPPRIFPSRFKCVPVYGISHANASAIEIRFAACRLVDPEPHARTRNRVKVNKKSADWDEFCYCFASVLGGIPCPPQPFRPLMPAERIQSRGQLAAICASRKTFEFLSGNSCSRASWHSKSGTKSAKCRHNFLLNPCHLAPVSGIYLIFNSATAA